MDAKDLGALYMNQSRAINNYLSTGDENNITIYEENLKLAYDTLDRMLVSYTDEQENEKVSQLVAFQTRYDELIQKIIAFKNEGNVVGYTNLLNTSAKTIDNVFSAKLMELDQKQESIVFGGIESIQSEVQNTKIFVVVVAILSILVGVILAIVISRSISRPIVQASAAIKEVAEGNLAIEPLQVKNKDEVGELVESFNLMVKDFREVVGKVQESSQTVAASSEELAASAEESTAASEHVARITQLSAEDSHYN